MSCARTCGAAAALTLAISNPGETANVLSGSTAGKPRHLEAANRRCTAIVVDIVRAPSTSNHMFGPMLGAHVKCLLKRTSLYDVQGVFCVMDWLDGVLIHIDTAELHAESLIDIDFIIETVGLLLREADHALALMRTVAVSIASTPHVPVAHPLRSSATPTSAF